MYVCVCAVFGWLAVTAGRTVGHIEGPLKVVIRGLSLEVHRWDWGMWVRCSRASESHSCIGAGTATGEMQDVKG